MEIETDKNEVISGIPENAAPDKLTNNIDYSIRYNLLKIDGLPIFNIKSIDGKSCDTNGEYTITGNLEKGSFEDINSNFEIRFSFPDSNGLCYITDKNSIEIKCLNQEEFGESEILIEKRIVQDLEGNDLFIINNFTNPERFECEISPETPPSPSTIAPEEPPYDRVVSHKDSSSGLSGGAIGGIVIAVVLLLLLLQL